ncbi:hypothetical protein V493_08700 [Pseudogymnoascus sp. VKM F-4281 (FW-2241)]|nr:hypothetical protein V493_08700 [Pseudogymnoascus sp. VKM F-4281 (FW-2241)]
MADVNANGRVPDDHDDSDYEPTTDEETDDRLHDFFEQLMDEDEDEDEGSGSEVYYDAEGGATIEVMPDTEGEGEEAQEYDLGDLQGASPAQIFYLWARQQLLLRSTHDVDDGQGATFPLRRRRRREKPDPNRFPKVPSERGTELMSSGDFGTNEIKTSKTIGQRKKLASRILNRELGVCGGARHRANQNLMAQGMIPSSKVDTIINYDAPVYSGQFSDDGNFFFACVKDFKVRMYDTSNPYQWRYYKTVHYPFGRWTLTDASLSPDNRYLAYTSVSPRVCLAPTDPNDLGDPYDLDLSNNGTRGIGSNGFRQRHDGFGIFSIRFSGDGRELVAGTSSESILVHDIESRQTILEINGHEDEVNAVCFADKGSSNIIFSGSDDNLVKIWDRRSMGDSREAGAFVGHTEGVTYIDSNGDGRYCLSNGKDQTMKLWDLRRMTASSQLSEVSIPRGHFDYRWGSYDLDDWRPHPNDNSVVTFRGHDVLSTLIRCHFSPPNSSNRRYVYSGSSTGKVFIWNMDATIAGEIDVQKATQDTRPFDREAATNMYYDDDAGESAPQWRTCVRDASWSPNAPVIAASAWNGHGMTAGTVTTHSWNDEADDDEAELGGVRVNEKLEVDPSYYSSNNRTPRRRRGRMGW